HLIAVTVEHQRFPLAEFADATLFRLAPARMIDRWIYIGVEPVFVRRRQFPGDFWLLGGKADAHDRLGALETVLPWNHHAHGCAVLVWQRPAVKSHRQQGQWMHRFVHAQALDVGPVEDRLLLPG